MHICVFALILNQPHRCFWSKTLCNFIVVVLSPPQIGRMIIDYNDLDAINFDDVIGLLRAVTDRLSMIYCFTDGRGGRKRPNEEEKEKIQDALNNLENPV